MTEAVPWLDVRRGSAPLLVSLPHTGTGIPPDLAPRFVSPWLVRKDADWWIDRLYDFAGALDATIVHTAISRSVIDVNRDPSGVSLYRPGEAPDAVEIEARRHAYFEPYHAGLSSELARLAGEHPRVVIYDCHSIRSRVPRLFDGLLPVFNIGTNSAASCDHGLSDNIEALCDASGHTRVTNGRFKGGFITRRYGNPADGIHAVQMELACRAYMAETPGPVSPETWPSDYDDAFASPLRDTLRRILEHALAFARTGS